MTKRDAAVDGLVGTRGIAPGASTRLDRWALGRIWQSVRTAPLTFELWDGFQLGSPAASVGTVHFKNRPALYRWVWDPELYFGETYMFGDVEIGGDLMDVLDAVYQAIPVSRRRSWWLWQPSNNPQAAKQNVHHHYDLGNEFYRLWLDLISPLQIVLEQPP